MFEEHIPKKGSGVRASKVPYELLARQASLEDWSRDKWMQHDAQQKKAAERFYVPLHVKFAITVLIGAAWTALSVWLAQPWVKDLSSLTNPVVAYVIVSSIAFIPGFIYAFMTSSLLLDKRPKRKQFDRYPGVTLLVPAYNEENVIDETLAWIARLDYEGPMEVLVVNDGSTDATAKRVQETLAKLDPPANMAIRLLDFTRNRGKAAALNKALAQASFELICTIDADSRPRPEAMSQIVGRMLSDPPDTQAVAGEVLVANSRETFVTRIQEWDYFHGIAAVKRIQSMYHGTLVAQGAFSLYRKSAIEEVGGWPEMVGEDIALTWAMLEKGHRIGFAEDAIAWTVAPRTLGQFVRQRKRWARGMIEALKLYWPLLFKPRMTTLFIWWNVMFLPMDLIYTIVFIPGLLLALLGIYWIAGPMTLTVLPLAALSNIVIYEIQRQMFRRQGLKVRRNYGGFLVYALLYALVMQPIGVWGYASELFNQRKTWETK